MYLDKRGGVHVDWILSMGLFLVSTILLFAFLKPGVVPLTEEKILLDVLVHNFNNNFLWNIKTTPYFIETCTIVTPGPAGPGGGQPNGDKSKSTTTFGDNQLAGSIIKKILYSRKDSFFKFITGSAMGGDINVMLECTDGLDNDEDGAIDYPNDFSCSDPGESTPRAACQNENDDDGDGAIDYPNDPGCNSPQDNSESEVLGPQVSNLSVNLNNNWKFSKIRYSDSINDWVAFTGRLSSVKIYCTEDAQNGVEDMIFHIEPNNLARFLFTYNNDNTNSIDADVSINCEGSCNYLGRLGSEEEVTGINLVLLRKFKLGDGAPEFQNTTELKLRWGFPKDNDFWIQGWKESDQNCGRIDAVQCNYIVNYKTANPSDEDNVKVKEIKTFILRKDGFTEDVRIFFRAW